MTLRHPNVMIPGEEALLSKNATLLVPATQLGIKPRLSDALLGGRVAIGGTLMLTNYRLAFTDTYSLGKSGELGFALARIHDVRNSSRGFWRTITVYTEVGDWRFVVWGIPELLLRIDEARSAFDPADLARVEAGAPLTDR